jgi:transposase
MKRRFELSDEQFQRLAPLLPGKPGDPGFVAADNRLFLDAVLWIARTGAPWRDLPERFGHWNSVHKRFYRWATKGTWKRVFDELQDPDLEWLLIDSTIVRVHQHAAGAEGSTAADEAMGRSRGGNSTKIHVAVDGLGNPVRVVLSPGQAGDITFAPELVAGLEAGAVVGDKGYDSEAFVKSVEASGAEAVIPPKKNRVEKREYDRHVYKVRNLVERFMNQLKQLRRVATRYEKTAASFLAVVHLGATMILLK